VSGCGLDVIADHKIKPLLLGIAAHHLPFDIGARIDRQFFVDHIPGHARRGRHDHASGANLAIHGAVNIRNFGFDVSQHIRGPANSHFRTPDITVDGALDLTAPSLSRSPETFMLVPMIDGIALPAPGRSVLENILPCLHEVCRIL